MRELINKLLISGPWVWALTGMLIGIIVLHVIPRIYKEALNVFFVAKYSNFYQQSIAYSLTMKQLEKDEINRSNKQEVLNPGQN